MPNPPRDAGCSEGRTSSKEAAQRWLVCMHKNEVPDKQASGKTRGRPGTQVHTESGRYAGLSHLLYMEARQSGPDRPASGNTDPRKRPFNTPSSHSI